MKTFSQCLEEAKTAAAEFVRHSAYDKEFKTVEVPAVREESILFTSS
jgi:hypothetical protein